jgi:hypothetical protein
MPRPASVEPLAGCIALLGANKVLGTALGSSAGAFCGGSGSALAPRIAFWSNKPQLSSIQPYGRPPTTI